MAEIDDIRNMNDQDLEENLDSIQKDLMNLRFRTATMQLTDTNAVKRTQRKIARIMTVIREREISESSL
ncbi:MAG: large subunit ribosomal protein L29 [Chloroflexi bacterium]|jgi:large subunit ribosomal protein L29|nr:MAG: large subunit ribosomal protein L29 [Chloroflexota bacterium]